MIKINTTVQSIEQIISQYPIDSMENKIVTIINNSNNAYSYRNIGELQFEVELRAQLVYASIAMNMGNMSFAVFRKTRCNEQFWQRQRNGGFTLKRGVSPIVAVKDIIINSRDYATECATAMVMVYYLALAQIFPQELFDKTFPKITLMNWHSLDRDIAQIGMMSDRSDNIPGDRRYFKNPDVDLSTPEWQGENVIDLSDGRYYGHGIGITNSDQIIRHLNSNRKSGSRRTAYLMDNAGNPDYKELYSILERYLKMQSQVTV